MVCSRFKVQITTAWLLSHKSSGRRIVFWGS